MVMMMMMMTMMSRRKWRGYLRTVTFESVNKTPHLLLYSSISVHCHTVNSLFRLPHSMLTVLYRNVLQVISLVRRNSNCCEAQNVIFCSGMSTSKCNKSHLQMTENHKHVGILRTAPHTDFRSLLSHCTIFSQWLPCWILYVSGNKLSRHTFLIYTVRQLYIETEVIE